MIEQRIGRRGFAEVVGITAASLAGWALLKDRPGTVPERVGFTEDGVMLIGKKEFFPIVFYGVAGDPEQLQSWQKAKEAGANTIAMFFPTERALNYAQKLDLKTIIRLNYLFPHYEANEQELERILKRKSVIAFEIDEPNEYWRDYPEEGTNKTKKEALFDLLIWLRTKTDLPLRVTTDGRAHLIKNKASVDFLEELTAMYPNVILGPDVYSDNVGSEVATYSDYWKKQRQANYREVKTVWSLTSAHSQDIRELGRSLTYEDIFYHAMSGIVAGARGIGFYDNPWGCGSGGCPVDSKANGILNAFGKHLKDVKMVNQRIMSALPGLLGQEVRRGKDKGLNFRIMLTGEAGSYYVFWTDDLQKEAGISFVPIHNPIETT